MSTYETSNHIESAKDASTGRRNEAVPFLFLYVITSTDDRRRRHEMKLQLHIRGVCSRSYRFSIPLLQIFPLFSLLGSKTNRDPWIKASNQSVAYNDYSPWIEGFRLQSWLAHGIVFCFGAGLVWSFTADELNRGENGMEWGWIWISTTHASEGMEKLAYIWLRW